MNLKNDGYRQSLADYDPPVMLSIMADRTYWIDSDGLDEWPELEAITLAAMLEGMGYDVELI